MKTFKGTKGKLKIIKKPLKSNTFKNKNEWHGDFRITNDKGEVFATVNAYSFYGITYRRAQANAKLIASSPELLEALQGLSELIDNGDLVRDISKDDDKSYYISQGLRIVQAIGKCQKAINKAL